jgi:hypothetical protein
LSRKKSWIFKRLKSKQLPKDISNHQLTHNPATYPQDYSRLLWIIFTFLHYIKIRYLALPKMVRKSSGGYMLETYEILVGVALIAVVGSACYLTGVDLDRWLDRHQ